MSATGASGMSGRTGWRDLVARQPTGVTILVVDDDDDVRTGLTKLLMSAGCLVRSARSAEEADTYLARDRFDVCLLDIELPGMSGVEFLVWAEARDPEMAVIMLTGMDAPDLALECLDGGARTFLVKPVDAAFLLRAVRDAAVVRRLLVECNTHLIDLYPRAEETRGPHTPDR